MFTCIHLFINPLCKAQNVSMQTTLTIKSTLINKGTIIALRSYTEFPVKRGRGCSGGEH